MTEKRGSCLEMEEPRRGPWTLEEDTLLSHYIACHGEGRWNLLARCSGLKRSGKSCRLRWLNYLKPDIKRGNLSPEEQFLILELHSKWGNRWSRIAQHLPGRTDNEIKNYWRTRVQKQARQLNVDANSTLFHDTVRCYWIPRLLRKMGSSSAMSSLDSTPPPPTTATAAAQQENCYSYTYYNEFSSCSTTITSSSSSMLPEFPANNKMLSSSIDELDGVERLNPLRSGYSSMIDKAHQAVESSWDAAVIASAAPTSSHSASNYADSWWSMDELHDMLKSYRGSEAEESKVVP